MNNTNGTSKWIRDNLWNLILTTIGIVVAFTVMQTKISFLEVRAQANYDRISKLEELINNLPDKETLNLELAPIKSDLTEIKIDLKKHLQQ